MTSAPRGIMPTISCRRPSISTFCPTRSEEHTSELQSRLHLVCRLLLETKRYECLCDQGAVQRCDQHIFESVTVCSGTRASDHSRSHMVTPALPFCHSQLQCANTRGFSR